MCMENSPPRLADARVTVHCGLVILDAECETPDLTGLLKNVSNSTEPVDKPL